MPSVSDPAAAGVPTVMVLPLPPPLPVPVDDGPAAPSPPMLPLRLRLRLRLQCRGLVLLVLPWLWSRLSPSSPRPSGQGEAGRGGWAPAPPVVEPVEAEREKASPRGWPCRRSSAALCCGWERERPALHATRPGPAESRLSSSCAPSKSRRTSPGSSWPCSTARASSRCWSRFRFFSWSCGGEPCEDGGCCCCCWWWW